MPEIETLRLRLRPITFDDLPALARLWSDPEVMRYLPTGESRSVEATRVELSYMVKHWQDHGFGMWAVTLKDEGAFIGYCGIQYLHEEPCGVTAEALEGGTDVEVIVGLGKRYWWQGIAREATEVVLRYGFETVLLWRIVAAIHPENEASRHILGQLGLKYDAAIGYYGDCPHFVITREEYQADDSFYVVHRP
jgi:ribosomal-protein-alanine N-acetyltransferase